MNEASAVSAALSCKVIAVVGMSREAGKPSHDVPAYLKEKGYEIIPVNPNASEILGEKCFPSLAGIPEELARKIEVVEVFRPSAQAGQAVDEAVALRKKFGRLKAVWLQLEIKSGAAGARAEEAGLLFIQDRCMKVEHARMRRI